MLKARRRGAQTPAVGLQSWAEGDGEVTVRDTATSRMRAGIGGRLQATCHSAPKAVESCMRLPFQERQASRVEDRGAGERTCGVTLERVCP